MTGPFQNLIFFTANLNTCAQNRAWARVVQDGTVQAGAVQVQAIQVQAIQVQTIQIYNSSGPSSRIQVFVKAQL